MASSQQLGQAVQQQPLFGTTPAELAQRRAYIAALMKSAQDMKVGSPAAGLGKVGTAAIGGFFEGQTNKEEREARQKFSEKITADLQGGNREAILADLSSPWASEGYTKVLAEALAKRNLGETTVSQEGQSASFPTIGSTVGGNSAPGPQGAPVQTPTSTGVQTPPVAPVQRAPLNDAQLAAAVPGESGNFGGNVTGQSPWQPIPANVVNPGRPVRASVHTPGPDQSAPIVPNVVHSVPAGPPPGAQPSGSLTPLQGLPPQTQALMDSMNKRAIEMRAQKASEELSHKESMDVASQLDQHKKNGIGATEHLNNIKDLLTVNPKIQEGTLGIMQKWASEKGVELGQYASDADAFRARLKMEMYSQSGLVNILGEGSKEFKALDRQIDSIGPGTPIAARADILHSMAAHYQGAYERGDIARNRKMGDDERLDAIANVVPKSPFGRLGYPQEEKSAEGGDHGKPMGIGEQRMFGGIKVHRTK